MGVKKEGRKEGREKDKEEQKRDEEKTVLMVAEVAIKWRSCDWRQ